MKLIVSSKRNRFIPRMDEDCKLSTDGQSSIYFHRKHPISPHISTSLPISPHLSPSLHISPISPPPSHPSPSFPIPPHPSTFQLHLGFVNFFRNFIYSSLLFPEYLLNYLQGNVENLSQMDLQIQTLFMLLTAGSVLVVKLCAVEFLLLNSD